MRKLVLVAASVAALTTAHAGPIEDREALMKSFGKALGQLAPVAKGERPFDADAVKTTLATLNTQAQKFDVATLFPEGSTNAESTASQKIWEDKAGFQGKVDDYKADVMAASSSPTPDVASLQAKMETIGSDCGGCHQTFRVKKN